jgi:hypothetical protein
MPEEINVTVTFWGICTVIHEEDNPRIALVAAREDVIRDNCHLADRGIDPHVARVHIRTHDILAIGSLPVAFSSGMITDSGAEDWMRFDLSYVRMKMLNMTQCLEMRTSCLPHLLAMGRFSAPDVPTVATDDGGTSVACVFELTHGLLSAHRKAKDGAAISVLTSQVEGNPVLCFWPYGVPSAASTITLRRGASIVITNLPDQKEGVDHPQDFLLHYLTLTTFPAAAGVPTEADVQCPVEMGIDDAGLGIYVGPGCSNSDYP